MEFFKVKNKKFDVITIGSIMQDIFTRADLSKVIEMRDSSSEQSFLCFTYGGKLDVKEVAFTLGGGGCNTAVSLTRMGFKTATVGIVGKDETGERVISVLKKEGVNTSFLFQDANNKTGLSVVLNSFEGERTILVYRGANNYLDPAKFDWQKLAHTKWIYLCGITGKANGILEKLPDFIKKHQIKLAWNPGSQQINAGSEQMKKLLAVTEVLIMNKEEAAKFTREEPSFQVVDEKKCNGCKDCVQICPQEIFRLNEKSKAAVIGSQRCVKCGRCVAVCKTKAIIFQPWMINISEIIKKLKAYKPKIVIVTDGKRGTQVFDGKTLYAFGIYPQKVVDTLGAGDAFGSAFMAGLISKNDIEFALKLGTANAASVVSNYGSQTGLLTFENALKTLLENKKMEVQKYRL